MTSTTKRILIGCAFGLVGIVITLVLGRAWLYRANIVHNIEASVSAPLLVELNEPFVITIRIKNTAETAQSLIDLDVAKDYLRGIAVGDSSPPFKESTGLPMDGGTSYTFNHSIPAHGEFVVTLQAVGVEEGDYTGDIDVCINSAMAFTTHQVRTKVTNGV
jgi:hypothetical protein